MHEPIIWDEKIHFRYCMACGRVNPPDQCCLRPFHIKPRLTNEISRGWTVSATESDRISEGYPVPPPNDHECVEVGKFLDATISGENARDANSVALAIGTLHLRVYKIETKLKETLKLALDLGERGDMPGVMRAIRNAFDDMGELP